MLTEGPLVIADISGYTKFVAQTEIDHSLAIVRELLDTTVAAMKGHLEVSQVEGDCILFIGGLTEQQVLPVIERCFTGFHRRVRAMQEMTTCPCAACRSLGMLTLKFVAHRGPYRRTKVGAIEQLHGSDVIVAFRLLKNDVPGSEYVLATEAFLERLEPEARAGFTAHREEYEHLGAIDCAFRDLGLVWQEAQARERRRVQASEAKVAMEAVLDVPIEEAWALMTDPETVRETIGVHSVSLQPGARGGLAEGAYHCHHGKDGAQVSVMRVVLADQPHTMTMTSEPVIVSEMWQTFHLEDAGQGRTRCFQWVTWNAWPGVQGKLKDAFFKVYMGRYMPRMKKNMEAIAQRRAAASGLAPST